MAKRDPNSLSSIILTLAARKCYIFSSVRIKNHFFTIKYSNLLRRTFSDSLFAVIKTNNMFSIATRNAKNFGTTILYAINHYWIAIVTEPRSFNWEFFAIDWVWVTMESLHFFIFTNKEFHILQRLTSSTILKVSLFWNFELWLKWVRLKWY